MRPANLKNITSLYVFNVFTHSAFSTRSKIDQKSINNLSKMNQKSNPKPRAHEHAHAAEKPLYKEVYKEVDKNADFRGRLNGMTTFT